MTFLLDTNVVSELRKASADDRVVTWARPRAKSETFLSVITAQEIEFGVLLRERRDHRQGAALRRWFERLLTEYTDRLLPVTSRSPDERRCCTCPIHARNETPSSPRPPWSTG